MTHVAIYPIRWAAPGGSLVTQKSPYHESDRSRLLANHREARHFRIEAGDEAHCHGWLLRAVRDYLAAQMA